MRPINDRVFTSQQVMRIAGISKRQLDYWITKGVVAADIDQARGRGRVRLFSFSNLVEVRAAAWLRDMVSLQLIRQIVERLRAQGTERPLSDMKIGVVRGDQPRGHSPQRVVVQQPDGIWEEWRSGQRVMEISLPLATFAEEIHERAAAERDRSRVAGRTEKRRGALGSIELIAGTRVPVAAVIRLYEAGYSIDRILESYPGLLRRDVEELIRRAEKGASNRKDSA